MRSVFTGPIKRCKFVTYIIIRTIKIKIVSNIIKCVYNCDDHNTYYGLNWRKIHLKSNDKN